MEGMKPVKRRIAPVALAADDIRPRNLEQADEIRKEPSTADGSVDVEGLEDTHGAAQHASHSAGEEGSDNEDQQGSGSSMTEPQGPLTEEQLQQLVDQLIDVELQNYEMQEELEEESLQRLREEVAVELGEQYQGIELEAAVESELALFKEYKEEDLNEQQAKAAEMQELLEDAGVFLRGIYMQIDEIWSQQAKTQAWKNAQWTKDRVPETVKAVLKEADCQLEAQRPVGKDKEGRKRGIGASGFIGRRVQEMRKKSKEIERRKTKEAAKREKQAEQPPQETPAGEAPEEDAESSSSEEDAVSEPEGYVSGEEVWKAVGDSDEEEGVIAKLTQNATEKVMLRRFLARYKAETPEEAVRFCETIEGATEVEDIGESGVADGLLKRALKEEEKKGLTETQRKTMKKRGEDEDRVKAVRQRKKHVYKEPKRRKPRAPRAPAPKAAVSVLPTEPLKADAQPTDAGESCASPSTPKDATAQAAAVGAPLTQKSTTRAGSQAGATEVLEDGTSAAKSFQTARDEDASEDASGLKAQQDGAQSPRKRHPPSVEQADFPACEAADDPMDGSEGEREGPDEKAQPVDGTATCGEASGAAEPAEGALGGANEAEIPSPSDENRQDGREGRDGSRDGSTIPLKRPSLGGSPSGKRPRFEVPTGVEVVDLASESEGEAVTPAPALVEMEDTEPVEGNGDGNGDGKQTGTETKTGNGEAIGHGTGDGDGSEEKSGTEETLGENELRETVEPPVARRTRGQLRAVSGGLEPGEKLQGANTTEEGDEEYSKEDDRTVEEVARDAARKRHFTERNRMATDGTTCSKGDETAARGDVVGTGPDVEATTASCAASATPVAGAKEGVEVSSPVKSPVRGPACSGGRNRKMKRLSQLETPSVWKGGATDSEAATQDSDLADGTPAKSEGVQSRQKGEASPKKRTMRRLVLLEEDEEDGRELEKDSGRGGIGDQPAVESSEREEIEGSNLEDSVDAAPLEEGLSSAEAPGTPKAHRTAGSPRRGTETTSGKKEIQATPQRGKKDGTVEDYDSDEEMEEAGDSDAEWDRKKDRELAKREAAAKGPTEKKDKKRKSATDAMERVRKSDGGKAAAESEGFVSEGFVSARESPSKRQKSGEGSKDDERDDDVSVEEVSGGKKGGKGNAKKGRKKGRKGGSLGYKCTTCPKVLKPNKVQRHPVLLVTQCRKCVQHYKAATFPVGEDGWEEECQWCGDGGTLTLCTACKKTVCKDCVIRNLGEPGWEKIKDDWVCYSCDSEPIGRLQDAHRRAAEIDDEEKGGAGPEEEKPKEAKKKKGRRNIKAIDEELDPETQAKMKMERERLERIEKRRANTTLSPLKGGPSGARGTPRKSIPGAVDEESPEMGGDDVEFEEEAGDGNSGRSVIINSSRPDDEDPVFIDPAIAEKLKPHQVDGVRFMWDNIVETVKTCAETPREGLGCILAHSMGLGKTLQVVTLVHTLLTNRDLNIRTVLIVVPVNVLRNWSSEFDKWQGGREQKVRKKVRVYTVEDAGSKNEQRAEMLGRWQRTGGAMIIGYTAFRNAVSGRTVKDAALRESFTQSLRDPGPDVLICDEAHMIKNIKADITKELKAVKTRRRVALTGSPLQNNLLEYYCMVDFVRERLLGTVAQFKNKFQNPISNGQHIDSTNQDVRVMKRRSHVLHKMLRGFVQRKDQRILGAMLPRKSVYVISVRLSPLQRRLYQRLLDAIPQKLGKSGKNYLFQAYQSLTKVWNHPNLLHMAKEKQDAKAEDTLEDAVAGDDETVDPSGIDGPSSSARPSSRTEAPSATTGTAQPTCTEQRGTDDANLEEGAVNSPLKGGRDRNKNCPDGSTPLGEATDQEAPGTSKGIPPVPPEIEIPVRRGRGRPPGSKTKNKTPRQPGLEIDNSWWQDEMPEAVDVINGSGKVAIVMDLLRTATPKGDKMLVFSQSLFTLDVLELALGTLPRVGNDTGETWTKNREYYRLDGSTPSTARQKLVERFNDPSNTDVKCVLISTKAGSLGINLPAANRVVIFDGSWNPTHDLQAMFRAWRFGQTKPVFVYRLLACGTMEENIYARQVTKESLSARVVDEQQVANHFSNQELESLYHLAEDDDDYVPEEDPSPSKPSPQNPKPPTSASNNNPTQGNGNAFAKAAGILGAAAAPGSDAARVLGAAAAAAGAAAAAQGASHPEKMEEAVKEAMRRGVKEFAIGDGAPPKDDVLARVLLRNRPKWVVRYHEHDVLLEDKELEHLDEREKALAWKEHEEAAIREAQPELSQYQINAKLLLGELHQVEQNSGLSDEEKRTQMRAITNKIALQQNLQAQMELQQRHQEELMRAAAAAQQAMPGHQSVPGQQAMPRQQPMPAGQQVPVATRTAPWGQGPTGAVPAGPLMAPPDHKKTQGQSAPMPGVAASKAPGSQPSAQKEEDRSKEGDGNGPQGDGVGSQADVDKARAKQEYARRMALYAKMGMGN